MYFVAMASGMLLTENLWEYTIMAKVEKKILAKNFNKHVKKILLAAAKMMHYHIIFGWWIMNVLQIYTSYSFSTNINGY